MADSRVLQVRFLGDTEQLGKSVEGIGSKFSGLKVAGAAAAVATGAVISEGIAKSLEFGEASAKLHAQLGENNPFFEKAGEVAGHLYSHAYGENLGEVNEAVKTVIQSGALMGDTTSANLEKISARAMSLSSAFGQDLTGTMNAVTQMLRTGLAPNAEAALDILAKGFQNGNDKAGDLLDTFNEYGTQFRKLGIDGTMAMGLISQGLQAGARDADVVADAIKEFSIRAVDGSKTTADGFKAIGLNAEDMAKKIGQGGPVAEAALQLTLNKLREIKDPALQAQTAVQLFGTQAEDLGKALFALDPSKAVAVMGAVQGAADEIDQRLGDNAKAKITGMQRAFEMWTASIVSTDGPLGDVAASVMAFAPGGLDIVGNIGMIALSMRGLGLASLFTAAGATTAWAALTGPVGIAVALIAGAAFLIITNWQAIKDFFGSLPSDIMGAITGFPAMLGGWASNAWQSFSGATEQWWTGQALPFVTNLPYNIGYALGSLVGILITAAVNGWQSFFTGSSNLWFGTIWPFITSIPGRAASGVAALPGVLWNAGSSALRGLHDGAIAAWGGFWGFVTGIPGAIVGGVGNLGSLLWNAGRSVIDGLLAGIKSGYQSMINFVSGIAGGIAAHKGPLSYDRQLLTPAGNAIMGGLLAGLRSGWGDVQRYVSSVAPSLSGAMSGSIAVATPASVLAGAPGGFPGGRLVIDSAGSRLDDVLVQVLKNAIRDRGGDPGILGI